MRWLITLIATVAVACTATPVVLPSSGAAVTPTASRDASPTSAGTSVPVTPSPSPTATFSDLLVHAAADARGVLAVETTSSSTAGIAGKTAITVVPLDGSARRQVVSYTRGPEPVTAFDYLSLSRQLSADGHRLVLSDPVDVAGEGLAIVDLVAGSARRVALEMMASQPAWSPDGTQIAYIGRKSNGHLTLVDGIWIVNADGTGARRVVPDDGSGYSIGFVYTWTPDGSGVVYTGKDGVGVVDVASGTVTRIGEFAAGGAPIAVRARQPSIAILLNGDTRRVDERLEIRDRLDDAGRMVLHSDHYLVDPRWRPGADELLLNYPDGEGASPLAELVIVDAVTGTVRTVPTPFFVRSAAWTADGSHIVYADLHEVRIRDADGSHDALLLREPAATQAGGTYIGGLVPFAPH